MRTRRCVVLGVAAMILMAVSFGSSSTMGARAKGGEGDLSSRSLLIAVSKDAPPEVKAAAEAIRSAAGQQAFLKLAAGAHDAKLVDTATLLGGPYQDRAFNHLVIVGLPDDPLVATVWQREAAIEPGGVFVFGFGHFKGDIGYIESDRNPFLHGIAVASAPYEDEIITITGTTPAGVALAANAFVHRGIVNGVIAAEGQWSRPSASLLDRDPIAPGVQLPTVPVQMGKAELIGVTQASGDEYRNVLADTDVEPKAIWRFKYYLPGAWDTAGTEAAIDQYKAGLHRRAFADTLWVGVFSGPEEASASAVKIAQAVGLSKADGHWKGEGKSGNGTPIELSVNGSAVYMSDLRR